MLYKCINNKVENGWGILNNIEEGKEYNVVEEFSITIKKNKYDMVKLDNGRTYQKDRFVLADKEF